MATRCETETLKLLNLHLRLFIKVRPHAEKLGQPNPTDTRGWSQMVVSQLTGIKGKGREKGADLSDGSDVKAANIWDAIDYPRFNGCIKTGTKHKHAGKLKSFRGMPNLFFVLWDNPSAKTYRCRIWTVRPQSDKCFRNLCSRWLKTRGTNFQLHPPKGINASSNVFTNKSGNLEYPLLFCAITQHGKMRYSIVHYSPKALSHGVCIPA